MHIERMTCSTNGVVVLKVQKKGKKPRGGKDNGKRTDKMQLSWLMSNKSPSLCDETCPHCLSSTQDNEQNFE